MKLSIDIETRSICPLRTRGVYEYAADPSTEILCVAVKINDDPCKHIWCLPQWKPLIPPGAVYLSKADLIDLFATASTLHAFNASFERNLLTPFIDTPGLTDIPRWRCTAAKAATFALPRTLRDACKAVGTDIQKDLVGHKVMMKMCTPRADGTYWEKADDIRTLMRYCIKDVESEAALDKALPAMPKSEIETYHLSEKINDTGIPVDRDTIKFFIEIIKAEEKDLLKEVKHLTDSYVNSARQRDKALDWLMLNGICLDDLRKQTVKTTMKEEQLPANVRRVLEIRQSLSKSSVSKLNTMECRSRVDGMIRGAILYHGAGTGRFAGAGIQPHNYPRDTVKEQVIDALPKLSRTEIRECFGDVFSLASKSLRGMICAPENCVLLCSDFKSIEARVLAWQANETAALEAFRADKDLYKVAAGQIYGINYDEVTDAQRQIGKVATLALGYQGWLGAFKSMASIYGLTLSDDEAKDIIIRWRDTNARIVQYWKSIDACAQAAVQNPGRAYAHGNIGFACRGDFLHCKLPNGRLLSYHDPKMAEVTTPYGVEKHVVSYMGVNSYSRKWERQYTYGGKLTENIIQAIARDILVDAMKRLDTAGFTLCMHVHDEIIAVYPKVKDPKSALRNFERIMSETPQWAAGCPIQTSGWFGRRYRK